ncbi:hypothetical protein PGT21_019097 [Puccinia graminis f. sp. tritici]|uniref:Uncharacterized protein n=1 Tax=Puccinia graminis f. sp. tritici TaxID=56615 RepID=A0A5B0Q5U6_PUCGR|nr:hypothetical protein PGT21_019097 [Puccinia graminis f. sp. tritici]
MSRGKPGLVCHIRPGVDDLPVIRDGCGWPLFRKLLAGIRVSQRIPAAGRGDGRLEGSPSSQRGTCTSSRYIYLAGWKETLPAVEVQVPRRLEGNPSSRSVAGPLEGGYPSIPAWIPAAADGYPLAGADVQFR